MMNKQTRFFATWHDEELLLFSSLRSFQLNFKVSKLRERLKFLVCEANLLFFFFFFFWGFVFTDYSRADRSDPY